MSQSGDERGSTVKRIKGVREAVTDFADRLQRFYPLDKRAVLGAAVFTATLFLSEIYFFRASYYSPASGANYVTSLPTLLAPHIFLHLFAIICSLILSACYVYLSLTSSAIYKAIYFVIFAIAVFVEYTYQGTLTRFSDAGDVAPCILVTTPEMQINAARMYLNWWALAPCVIFGLLLLSFKAPKSKNGLKGLLIVLAVTLGFYSLMSRYVVLYIHLLKYPVVSVNALFRTVGDYVRVSAITYTGPREELEPIAVSDPPARNVIFVIDESIRGDHLSLNGYHRSTTPYLDELADQGLLLNWGIASSVTTCSGSSDLLLLSGLKLQDLPDVDNKAMKNPSIFQYAKALGYRTYYFDGQMNTFWNVKLHDMKYVDEWWNLNKLLQINNDYRQVDFAIAEAVRNVTTNSRGNFIWIIKTGAHVPYYKRFPESAAKWLPSYAGDRWDVHRQTEIVNAYDNAIRYNLEGFFSHLIPDYKVPDDTVIVYTSDHGQTLAEGREGSAHCGYTRNEAVVPLFVIGYRGAGVDTKYKASHPNIFATLLDLMEFPESARKKSYGRSLLKAREADSEPRYYVGPALTGNLQKLKFD